MTLRLEVELVTHRQGKNKPAAILTLSDAEKPRCLVPFGFYVGDVPALEERLKCKLGDLTGRQVDVICVEMRSAMVGNGIDLTGELTLAPGASGSKPKAA